ncbi:hypothetical protein S83_028624 [Arachis hypogaea]
MRLFIFPGNGPDSASTQPFPAKLKSKVNGGAVFPLQITRVKFQDFPLVNNFNTSDWVLDLDPKVNRPVEDSSSSCLNSPLPALQYDDFISFRGEDTRASFTSHLFKALSRKQIVTYTDDLLHKGDSITFLLLRTIEESCLLLVVFSENYASSKWCLQELVKIMECKKEFGRLVIPVFYNVDPSHVRITRRRRFRSEGKLSLQQQILKAWTPVLIDRVTLLLMLCLDPLPFPLTSYCRAKIEFIQNIVKDPPNDSKSLVGISENLEKVESLLSESVEVRMIGICGIGGIGKTTLARLIFEKYSYMFEGSCFLENVRERSRNYGLTELRRRLYLELLQGKFWQNNTGKSTFVEDRVSKQRNFIVLDDVSSLEQLDYLVQKLQWCGAGSKIIITARDKNVLVPTVETIYEMKILDSHESFKLLSTNWIRGAIMKSGWLLQRHPTSLNSIGKVEWHSTLQKLEKTPDPEIQNILRLSYDGLDEEAKQIFLDIACFFKRELVEYVVNLLDSYGLYAAIGMKSLLDRALIAISHNCVRMHDLIQELGWDIVCQQSSGNPENRSHLWDSNDIQDVLGNNKNLVNLEEVDLTDSQKLVELPDFSKADNLKSVHLSGCRSLRHVHLSLLSLGKLELLDLLNCAKCEMLETKMHS